MKLCANYDFDRLEQNGKTPLTFSKCQPSFFGIFDDSQEIVTTENPSTTSAIASGKLVFGIFDNNEFLVS